MPSLGKLRYRCEPIVRGERKSLSPISRLVSPRAGGEPDDLLLLRGEFGERVGCGVGDVQAAARASARAR